MRCRCSWPAAVSAWPTHCARPTLRVRPRARSAPVDARGEVGHTQRHHDTPLPSIVNDRQPRRITQRRSGMKVPAAVAEILKREGIEFLIGYPVNTIIEAAAEADIRTIIVRQERTGLHKADAVSRVSTGKRIGVFTMQHGPGSENAFGGVAQAYGDSVPIVVLPGGYPRRITNIPPNFNSALNYRHVTKWIEQVIMSD